MKRLLLAIVFAPPVAVYFVWLLADARSFQFLGPVISSVETEDRVVALTFDDGPTAEFAEEILAILRQRGVKATFFVTGREVEQNLAEARQIVAEGHELGNHSYSHPRLVLKSPSRIRQEVECTDAIIRQAGHQGEIYFRPPYGKKLFLLPWYLWSTGRTTITWNIEPESYPEVAADARRILAHVLDRLKPGSIILLHLMYESRAESRKALPAIIDRLHQNGYRFLTVSELLAIAEEANAGRRLLFSKHQSGFRNRS